MTNKNCSPIFGYAHTPRQYVMATVFGRLRIEAITNLNVNKMQWHLNYYNLIPNDISMTLVTKYTPMPYKYHTPWWLVILMESLSINLDLMWLHKGYRSEIQTVTQHPLQWQFAQSWWLRFVSTHLETKREKTLPTTIINKKIRVDKATPLVHVPGLKKNAWNTCFLPLLSS